jgi:stage II sporulation protein R
MFKSKKPCQYFPRNQNLRLKGNLIMHYINKTRFFALFFTLILLFTFILSYAKTAGANISDAVVRLHIVANSNSNADQQLKLQVRDRILSDATHIFKQSENPEQALNLARANTDYIKSIALAEIRRLGFDYDVSVNIGETNFPTKVYGNIALPQGRYNAVNIRIGDAKGENWWCVMYPPLCFTDGIVSASDDAKNRLKDSLSPSEYNLITKSSESVPVEIQFKLVEIFQKLF